MPMDDVLLEKYGEFYCSQYVAINQPWVREVPFHEWVERQLIERAKRMAKMKTEFDAALLLYYEDDMLALSDIA